ncbi:MAG: 5-(carboxyamino)imidazole ribonucleotide synthase [Methylococcus sp.]|nr:5-(carboxyamino)imidazole ribonucleotide synthase [Methylococcus sp.]
MAHILPPAMLGILGGGQLGRMFTMAARSMGYRVTVLDPDTQSPAGMVADRHVCAGYDDEGALEDLARSCAAVTTEFENVPADSLRFLELRTRVSPSSACVAIAQDRIAEKRYIAGAGLAVAPFLAVESAEDLGGDLAPLLPGILKTARFGYDGKGQARVETQEQALSAFEAFGCPPCVLERRLELDTEVSVIVARSSAKQVGTFPIAENHHEGGILDLSIVPARVRPEIAAKAAEMACALAEAMNYTGVLAVEFFVLRDGGLVINEIAPRPHNSGHYTLDACLASQFEQQVRTLCKLPPADTRLLSPVVMVNLLGDIWRDDEPAWDLILSEPCAVLHLYGKSEARVGRKMGHFNVLAETAEAALEKAEALKRALLI